MATSSSEYCDITAVASTGLTSNQYYFVRSTGVDSTYSGGNLTALLCTSSTNNASSAKGILQNDPDTGQAAIVRVHGSSKLVAGGVIGVGALIASSTAGTGIAATTTGEFCRARAESASTAAGQIISVRLVETMFMGSTA